MQEQVRERVGGIDRLGAAWLALAMVVLAFGLGGHALIDPDEGRNAAIARTMAESGELIVPQLNGLPHLDKPFLYYAVTAGSMRLFGPSEWAARLPSLLFAWATVLLVVWFAARLFGRRAAWIAGLACATAPMIVAYSRIVIFDSMLGFFVVLALIAFYLAIEAPERPPGRLGAGHWCALAWLAMALGVLVKGPVALLVPLLVAAPYAGWRRRSRAVWRPAGPLLLLAVVLPWVLAVEVRQPGFLRYALVTETWERLTTDRMQRNGPPWYFLPYLLAGAFPWILGPIVVALARLRRLRRPWRFEPSPELVYLLLWIALPLLFFSLSHSKRPHYILPLVPAVALLAARVWSRPRPPLAAARAAAAAWLLVAAGLLALVSAAPTLAARAGDRIAAAAVPFAWTLGTLALLSGLAAWALSRRYRTLAPIVLSLPLVALPLLAPPLLASVADGRTGKAVAAALGPRLTERAEVVTVESFSPSVTFYLDRPVVVSSASPELLGNQYATSPSRLHLTAESPWLRPAGWWADAVTACRRPLYLVMERPFELRLQALEEAGLPLLFADDEIAALGPCRPPPRATPSPDAEPSEVHARAPRTIGGLAGRGSGDAEAAS